ncbi:MAG: hypothetical protein NVS3B20_16260 [Polyangiales bacterium]
MVVRPEPCFSLYPLHLDVASASQRIVQLSLRDDFAYPTDALLAAARDAKVVFLVSPNNPTGSVIAKDVLQRLLRETRALVVVDEAYREWCGQDFSDLLHEDVPLVLLRTFSKALAAAGLRFGYLLGPASICSELEKVILPYSVNSLTQLAIAELMRDEATLAHRVQRVTTERARVANALRARGRRVVEGAANFILISAQAPALEFSRLLDHGVLVRDLSSSVRGFLRISIGSREDNDRLLELL